MRFKQSRTADGIAGEQTQQDKKVRTAKAGNVAKARAPLPCINSHPSTLVLLFGFRHLTHYLGIEGKAKYASESEVAFRYCHAT